MEGGRAKPQGREGTTDAQLESPVCSRLARIFSLRPSASRRAAAIFSWMSTADMLAAEEKCERGEKGGGLGRIEWRLQDKAQGGSASREQKGGQGSERRRARRRASGRSPAVGPALATTLRHLAPSLRAPVVHSTLAAGVQG